MKRALSFVLTLAMGFSVLTVSASAAQKPGPAQETFSIQGRQASSAMVEMLEEEGIAVTEDTTIQLVPLSSPQRSNSGNVLVITNQEGAIVTQDTLLLVSDDGVGFADMNDVMSRGSDGTDHENDKMMVHGVATYERHTDVSVFHRPLKASFSYKKYKTCDVSAITFAYECTGGIYSYPDYKYQHKDTTYRIRVDKVNPVASRTYSKSSPYPSDRVICTSSGAGGAGNTITYNVVVDGERIEESHNISAY